MAPSLPHGCTARFRPERELARGGFGVVYLATQLSTGRAAVIKVLSVQDPEILKRFEQEARITAALAHPHVVRVLDHDAGDGVPWIAYEYVTGGSLEGRMAGGRLPWREAVGFARDVADALAAVHAAGVLHRDIKPANILVDGEGRAKVTDFGIARWDERHAVHTATGVIFGSPHYIAPELLNGSPASAASDLYALGLVLYEAIAGRLPFAGGTLPELFHAHLNVEPADLRSVAPDVPLALAALVKGLLAKRACDRPAGGEQVVAALDALRERGVASSTGRLRKPGASSMVLQPVKNPGPRRFAAFAALLVVAAVAGRTALAPRTSPATASTASTPGTPRPVSELRSPEPSPATPASAASIDRLWSRWHLYAVHVDSLRPGGSVELAKAFRRAEDSGHGLPLLPLPALWSWWVAAGRAIEAGAPLPAPKLDQDSTDMMDVIADGTGQTLAQEMAVALARTVLQPRNGGHYIRLANALLRDGDEVAARVVATRGVEILHDPISDLPDAVGWIGLPGWLVRLGRTAEYPELARRGPNEALASLIDWGLETGHLPKALELVQSVRKVMPIEEVVVCRTGDLLAVNGRTQEARDLWHRFEVEHSSSRVRHHLAEHLLDRGRMDEARGLVQQDNEWLVGHMAILDGGPPPEPVGELPATESVAFAWLERDDVKRALAAAEEHHGPGSGERDRRYNVVFSLVGAGCTKLTTEAIRLAQLPPDEPTRFARLLVSTRAQNSTHVEKLLMDRARAATGPGRAALDTISNLLVRRYDRAAESARAAGGPATLETLCVVLPWLDQLTGRAVDASALAPHPWTGSPLARAANGRFESPDPEGWGRIEDQLIDATPTDAAHVPVCVWLAHLSKTPAARAAWAARARHLARRWACGLPFLSRLPEEKH